jgi:hypothetical protein
VVNSRNTTGWTIGQVEGRRYILGGHPESKDTHEHYNVLEQLILLVVACTAGSKQANHALVVQQDPKMCVPVAALDC